MSTPPNAVRSRRSRRTVKELDANQRSSALSHLQGAAEAAAPPNFPPESMFAPSALWGFMRSYLAYVFHKKHDFPPFTASAKQAMYDLVDEKNGSQDVRVSIAGDWGTGTNEAESVAERIEEFDPHFTIHIGDISAIRQ